MRTLSAYTPRGASVSVRSSPAGVIVVLVFALVLCLVSVTCLSDTSDAEVVVSGTCGEGVTFSLTDDGTLTISGAGAMDDSVEGEYPWGSEYRDFVTAVVIENGVSYIGTYAFSASLSLKSVVIPDYSSVGEWAFKSCYALTELSLGEHVTLGDKSFSYCESLKTVVIPEGCTFATETFYESEAIESVTISCSSVPYMAFHGCENLTTVTFTSYANVDKGAFVSCTSLVNVNLPDNFGTIKEEAFSGCPSIESLTIPNATLEAGAFYGCSGIKSLDIGSYTVPAAFMRENENLETLTLRSSVHDIGDEAFSNCTALSSVTLPETINTVGSSAFHCCTSLNSVVISDCESCFLGGYSFYGCTALSDVTFGSGLQTIDDHAFAGCSSLKAAVLPDSVGNIGEYAFFGCTSLTEVSTGNGLMYIENGSFADCPSLLKFTLGSSVLEVLEEPFTNSEGIFEVVNLSSLEISPGSLMHGGIAANAKSVLTDPTESQVYEEDGYLIGTGEGNVYLLRLDAVSGDLPLPESIGGIDSYLLYRSVITNNPDLATVTMPHAIWKMDPGLFDGCATLEKVVVSDSIDSIPEMAFYGCTSLKEVEMPESVRSIGPLAFKGTAIKSFQTGSNMHTIGMQAFEDCTSLLYASFNTGLKTIDACAFNGCTSLNTVYLGNVETIGEKAFAGCPLSVVRISESCQVHADSFDPSVTVIRVGGDSSYGILPMAVMIALGSLLALFYSIRNKRRGDDLD